MVSCDLIRHTIFMLVSTLGFLFSNFYDEVLKTLVEDYSVKPIRNQSFYPDNDVISVIKNSSNLTDGEQEMGGASERGAGTCQLGYAGNGADRGNNSAEVTWFKKYNNSEINGETRFQCMRVALDAIHWFVVCVDEQDKSPRHWDQSQIEHIYSWMLRDPDLGLLDLDPGNGFYALAAGALNRTSILVGNPATTDLRRIQKGITISGLGKRVTLYDSNVPGSELCTKIALHCMVQNSTSGSYADILSMKPPQKAILKAKLNNDTVSRLLRSQALFKYQCIPFMILELDNTLTEEDTDSGSLVEIANAFISHHGYRPFTYNGIALALNNIDDWPDTVYWSSKVTGNE